MLCAVTMCFDLMKPLILFHSVRVRVIRPLSIPTPPTQYIQFVIMTSGLPLLSSRGVIGGQIPKSLKNIERSQDPEKRVEKS